MYAWKEAGETAICLKKFSICPIACSPCSISWRDRSGAFSGSRGAMRGTRSSFGRHGYLLEPTRSGRSIKEDRKSATGRGECLPAHQQGVLHLYAPVHDDGEAVLFGVACGLFVDHARLHPQDLRPGGDGILCGRHDLLAAAEHVHDVHLLRYVLDGGVGLLAQDRSGKVRVDREDPVPRVLHGSGYSLARAIWVVREPDDRDVACPFEDVFDLFTARILVHGICLLKNPSSPKLGVRLGEGRELADAV